MSTLTASSTGSILIIQSGAVCQSVHVRLEKADGHTVVVYNLQNDREIDQFFGFYSIQNLRKRMFDLGFSRDEFYLAVGLIVFSIGKVRRGPDEA